MKPIKKDTQTQILNTNINEMVHSLVREFSMACKKASIYGSDHPSTKRAVHKPFLLFDEIFKFKNYINFNFHKGYLYILNIRLKDSVFNEEIIRYMQILDLKSFLFKKHITLVELEKFINRFVKRVNLTDHSNLISSYLQDEQISTIEVNSERSIRMFEESTQYRGDVSHDFSLRNIILQQLPDDIEHLARLYQGDVECAEKIFIDYDFDLIRALIPDKVVTIASSTLDAKISEYVTSVFNIPASNKKQDEIAICRDICRLLELHPDYETITKKLENILSCENVDSTLIDDLKTPTQKFKIETARHIEELMSNTFTDLSIEYDAEGFIEAYARLLKSGQREKASEIADSMVNYLGDNSYDFRQKALSLLMELVKPLNLQSDKDIFEKISQVILRNLFNHQETFEYSEFIWLIIEKCLQEKEYELLSKIMHGLQLRLKIENNVTIYDSIAIKKVYMNFNHTHIIDGLIKELISGDARTSQFVREILVSAGSEEVAMALSHIISHPNRQVRQQALRILGELGHASLEVFGRILEDDEMFERDNDKRELPDDKWYVVRNSIFVFGLLKDQKACIPLRLRISDPDYRVRREIISALEKIGGEESVDTLMMMVHDDDREIREAAVITIGLIGTPEDAPLLISLVKKSPKVAIRAITALGKVGGDEALVFLKELMEDGKRFEEVAAGEISRDDLRIALIKALGNLGDTKGIKSIQEFQENQSTTQKIFFKNSSVNKAIKDILSKK